MRASEPRAASGSSPRSPAARRTARAWRSACRSRTASSRRPTDASWSKARKARARRSPSSCRPRRRQHTWLERTKNKGRRQGRVLDQARMDVVLIDIAHDPLTKLYGAYRTCDTPKTRREVWDDIAAGSVSREKIAQFVEERLKTGHVSPLEQVVFWFGISGVSRSLSHQFVRHRIGISFEQQSQRYVRFTGKHEERLEYVMPE